MREKYRGLKSKIRKYQRHVEDKELHYKQEYARLEAEFRYNMYIGCRLISKVTGNGSQLFVLF
jgi:hypothetical protein